MNFPAAIQNTEAAILARLIEGRADPLGPEVARYLLSLAFEQRDTARMNELAERSRSGDLTDVERVELDSYLHVSNLIATMQSKARRYLRSQSLG